MKLHKNIYLWYATTFFSYAAFTLPVWVIFNTEILGLSNTQAFILGVLPYGLSAIFEIPTGSWSDKYGRVRIYIIGTILYILSVASFIFFTGFLPLLIFQVLGGLGLAMASGGLEALVHDSIKGKDKNHIYTQVHGYKMAILFASRVITVLFSGYLFAINPKLPFVVATITYIIGLVFALFFDEVRLQHAPERTNGKHIVETVKLILQQKTLVYFFALVALFSLVSEALFAMYQPYFKSINIDIGEFGLFYAVISIFSAFGALSVARLTKLHNAFTIILAMMLSVILTLGVMLLRNPALVYLAIIPPAVAFGYVITLQNAATQKLISSSHQAAALSIASFVRTLPFFITVIMVGVLLDVIDANALNRLLLIISVIALIPFVIFVRRKITL